MSDVTRLLLVRHGESRAQVERVVGGEKGCTGLSELGRRQVEALRDRLADSGDVRAGVVWASVLPRAVETAEILAPALGWPAPSTDCDLCELHPGEADGMTWDDYIARYHPEGYRPDHDRVLSPGGESWATFTPRVQRRLERLVEEHRGETVVVACHGGVIISSLVAFMGLPPIHDFEAPPPPGELPSVRLGPINSSVTEWVHDAALPGAPWSLVRYNDAAHLEGLDA